MTPSDPRPRGIICAAAAVLLCVIAPARAADPERWLRFASPNFELYTAGDAGDARDTIQYFEQVRGFFVKAAPVRYPSEFPVRIIVFGGHDEFRLYSSNPMQVAYFASGAKRDYIVMADASSESYRIAVHEYMHLIVRHSGLHIPVWLNEGLADVYSTLRPVKGGVAVGDLIPGRMQPLDDAKWLSFESLTTATTRSPIYNEADRVGVFYAESWALTHMLFLSPDYRDSFGKFIMALHRGSTSAQACETAYGRPPGAVMKDLRKYLAGRKFYGRIFETELTRPEAQPAESALSPFDSRLMLADLLAATGRLARAEAEYVELERQKPGVREVAQSLGYFALAAGDAAQARDYFEKAFAAGETDPQMCLRLALLERQADQPDEKIIAPLERAVRSRPDYAEARIQLGLMKVKEGQYPEAIRTMMGIENVTPEQATPLFSALAYAYLQTGDVENSRKNAEQARKWARSAGETAGVERLAAFIGDRASGLLAPVPGERLEQAEGTLEDIDCQSEPHRLRISVEGKPLTLLLPEPRSVEFSQPGGGSVQLACGSQEQRRLSVFYAVGSGIVRKLQFLP